jgi:hypothetical protein
VAAEKLELDTRTAAGFTFSEKHELDIRTAAGSAPAEDGQLVAGKPMALAAQVRLLKP